MKTAFIYLFLILIILQSCTNNPFFGDDGTAKDKYVLRGKVALSDGFSPQNIYIWMKEGDFELYTRTNALGEFTINLPRTGVLSGYNGTMRIYYYVGNYQISFSTVLIADGKFEFDKYDINKDGFIEETILLHKLIDIKTNFIPGTFPSEYSDAVVINVQVSNSDSNLLVKTKMTRDLLLSAIIFREINSAPEEAIRFELAGSGLKGYYLNEPAFWSSEFDWPVNYLPPGQYEVYPYIFLEQPGEIPDGLLESFGSKANEFTEAYLKIPFKHHSDLIAIN